MLSSQPVGPVARIALIGDVHAEDALLERALDYCAGRVDAICCVGDIADGAGDAARCCAALLAHQVLTVRGNHDRWLLGNKLRILPGATRPGDLSAEARAFLEQLPATLELATPSGLLLLCHGLDVNDMAGVRPDDEGYALECKSELWRLVQYGRYRWLANGHTHRRMVRSFGSLTVINAGTLAREHVPGFVIFDSRALAVHAFDFDAEGRPFQAAEIDVAAVPVESRGPT